MGGNVPELPPNTLWVNVSSGDDSRLNIEVIVLLFETNKERGNAGLSCAIAYFGMNGYTVSIPLNDTQDYDLIVDKDGVLQRVQVKSTNVQRYGAYQVSLKSCGGTKGKPYKTVIESEADLLFVLCGDGSMYLIPVSDLSQRSTLALRDHYHNASHKSDLGTYKYQVSF